MSVSCPDLVLQSLYRETRAEITAHLEEQCLPAAYITDYTKYPVLVSATMTATIILDALIMKALRAKVPARVKKVMCDFGRPTERMTADEHREVMNIINGHLESKYRSRIVQLFVLDVKKRPTGIKTQTAVKWSREIQLRRGAVMNHFNHWSDIDLREPIPGST